MKFKRSKILSYSINTCMLSGNVLLFWYPDSKLVWVPFLIATVAKLSLLWVGAFVNAVRTPAPQHWILLGHARFSFMAAFGVTVLFALMYMLSYDYIICLLAYAIAMDTIFILPNIMFMVNMVRNQ